MLEIDDEEHDHRAAERNADEPERRRAIQHGNRRRRARRSTSSTIGVHRADASRARAAASAEHQPRHHRHVLIHDSSRWQVAQRDAGHTIDCLSGSR